jgi:hypothetical protein
VICHVDENLSSDFNGLKNCLFFNQVRELGQKQGKNWCGKNFPADLSTKRVDSFPLALGLLPLQRGARLNAS